MQLNDTDTERKRLFRLQLVEIPTFPRACSKSAITVRFVGRVYAIRNLSPCSSLSWKSRSSQDP